MYKNNTICCGGRPAVEDGATDDSDPLYIHSLISADHSLSTEAPTSFPLAAFKPQKTDES